MNPGTLRGVAEQTTRLLPAMADTGMSEAQHTHVNSKGKLPLKGKAPLGAMQDRAGSVG